MVLLQMTVRHGPHGPAPGAQGQGRVAEEEMAALEGRAFFLGRNIKVVETAASHHQSPHSFCALTGGALSTMREDIWGVAWRWCASAADAGVCWHGWS